ncbi:hypothetical protein [Xanthomonas campestris]|uniref:hypothetical protein n=1 Tax=Xanthomonas campestris TaxID=339 RepID=UPI001E2D4779|nr:hypothetical protein [Xanthomonas campestris]MCC5069714.1 hypothetical protein [Xanthomonas campestris]MCC5086675.1 hypothetical protein [Xanthomonas campestris]
MRQAQAVVSVISRQRLTEQGENLGGDIAIRPRLGTCSTRGGFQSPLRSQSMPINAFFYETAMRRRGAAHTVESITAEAMFVSDGALHAAAQSALPATATGVRSHWFDA